MNRAQQAAINRLEGALAACDRAGVALCGMDSNVYAYPASEFDRLHATGMSAFDVQKALQDESAMVEDGGAYRDSGGW